jgi:hypothetical protein
LVRSRTLPRATPRRVVFGSTAFSEDRLEDAENYEDHRQEVKGPEVMADVGDGEHGGDDRPPYPLETESR